MGSREPRLQVADEAECRAVSKQAALVSQKLRVALAAAVLAVIAIVATAAFNHFGEAARANDAIEIQKTLPKRIDIVTTLVNVHFDGRVMTYTYIVETGMQPFGDAAIQAIKDRHCGSLGWRGYFRDEHRYTDMSGRQLIAVARNRDCR